MISHRSGETEDTTIADLAVATDAGQIKTGRAVARRTASRSTTACCGSRSSSAPRRTTRGAPRSAVPPRSRRRHDAAAPAAHEDRRDAGARERSGGDAIEQLARAGVDCFRLNFSHGTPADHAATIARVRAVARAARAARSRCSATCRARSCASATSPSRVCSRPARPSRSPAAATRSAGDLELGFELDLVAAPAARQRGPDQRRARAAARRRRSSTAASSAASRSAAPSPRNKGVNLPGTYLPIPSLTEGDLEYLDLALDHDVDFVALSFVRRSEEVEDLKRIVARRGSRGAGDREDREGRGDGAPRRDHRRRGRRDGRARRPRRRDRRRGGAARRRSGSSGSAARRGSP